MPSEREWVHALIPKIQSQLNRRRSGRRLSVEDGYRLAYALEIQGHNADGSPITSSALYETDLCVSELDRSGLKTPRVVVECKMRRITTHTVLAYSTKAATHKSVYPYLRYGFLAGARRHFGVPARLLRHGSEFDFLCTWRGLRPSSVELEIFVNLLRKEVDASRKLQEIFTESRLPDRVRYRTIHRQLRLSE
jgi:hypothetical protein